MSASLLSTAQSCYGAQAATRGSFDKAKVFSISAQASQEKCSVGAEIRRPPRCPNCQPAPARLFVQAAAAFGASLKEG